MHRGPLTSLSVSDCDVLSSLRKLLYLWIMCDKSVNDIIIVMFSTTIISTRLDCTAALNLGVQY